MSQRMSYQPSKEFHNAASSLSTSTSLSGLSNNAKLELYGLFKFLTVSRTPQSSRPSIFDMTGRAKWDAWQATSKTWAGREADAEAHYLDIARSLGWKPSAGEAPVAKEEEDLSIEELLERESDSGSSNCQSGAQMGIVVSTANSHEDEDEELNPNSVHGYAISGNSEELESLLRENPEVNVDALDEYGFTPLQLACDRGNVNVVKILLEHEADPHLKDPDGFSALDLAREGGRDDIVLLLEKHI